MKIFFILLIISIIFTGCSNKNNSTNNSSYETNRTSYSIPKEEDLASFSTTILLKDEDRQNNIQIACNSLNGSIVKAR